MNKETINKIKARFETRARCTKQAKEDLQKILEWITMECPLAISGYESGPSFLCRYSYWDGSNWHDVESQCYFALFEGRADILRQDIDRPIETEIADLLYIDIAAAVDALRSFFEKLARIKTFEEEAEKLREVAELLGGKNDRNK